MIQTSGYSVSAMGTTLQGSQELPANMSDSQSSEVTQGQLELSLEPDVTVSQQLQIVQDQEEQEINKVGIDVVEHKTPEAETSEMKLGNEDTLQQSQPNTNTNP